MNAPVLVVPPTAILLRPVEIKCTGKGDAGRFAHWNSRTRAFLKGALR